MGHQIISEVSAGNCRLTQCSCGRGAFQVGKKVMLISSGEAAQIAAMFGGSTATSTPAMELNRLTDGKSWADFKPCN